MSTHIQCPSCERHTANIVSPDERWGQIYDGREIDRAADFDLVEASGDRPSNDLDVFVFQPEDGRETFECSCGQAIWIASRQASGGRWFVLIDVGDRDMATTTIVG